MLTTRETLGEALFGKSWFFYKKYSIKSQKQRSKMETQWTCQYDIKGLNTTFIVFFYNFHLNHERMHVYMSVCVSTHERERERERENHTNSRGNRYPEVQRQYNLGVPELQELKLSSKRLTKLQILIVSIVEGSS